MAVDSGLGLLIDRRSPSSGRPFPHALTPVREIDLGPNSSLSAWLVRASEGHALPRRVESAGFGIQIRLLDRFYLPDGADEDVVRTLFDTVATVYDLMTDSQVNLATAATLLEAACDGAGNDPLILDFGCGTGIAFDLIGRSKGPKCRLIGTDISSSMLDFARAKGETVIEMEKWRAEPPKVDGAIACFVMHYGVLESDLATISSSLRPNGVFAANMFRMSVERMAAVDAELNAVGFSQISRTPISAEQKNNVSAIYRRRS